MNCSTRYIRGRSWCTNLSLGLALIIILAAPQVQAQQTKSRFTVGLDIGGPIHRGSTVLVTVQVRALVSSPSTQAHVSLPVGVSAVSGETSWSGPLAADQTTALTFHARLNERGIYQISASVHDSTEVDDPSVSREAVGGIYLAVGNQAGFAERELTERFVPPARRFLPSLTGGKEFKPEEPEGGVVYQPTKGMSRRSEELSRALRSIDSLGVEALFEDSTKQVDKLKKAMARDQAAVEAAPEAPQQAVLAPGAAAALICPAGYWARTGYVEYTDINNIKRRLPNVLVYAANVPQGFGGGVSVTFRTEADGTFNRCFPVNSLGYTHVTLYQDVGGVYVHRDIAPDPKHVFPQWWGATWNLTVSPTLPLPFNTRHPEVSFALDTWNRALNASYSIFTARRSPVRAWYFTNGDTDRYCPTSFFIPKCTKVGEGIYFHKYTKAGDDNIWIPHGQRARGHEYGHAWDRAILGSIGGPCSGEAHFFDVPNNLACAVQEGWADFFAAITLPLLGRDGELIGSGSGPRGPEVEWAVANYLFDLIDKSSLPAARSNSIDDDPVAVDPNYLVQVIRDGRTNLFYPPDRPRSVQEIIALIDDITPIPAKAEFSAYAQPTGISTRVARSPAITVAQNRALWLKNIFNKVETPPPPFTVIPSVEDYITVKTTYPLRGTANAPATGWRWDRGDDGAAYTFWANGQNSQFVAYAGDYSIGWRLFARRVSDGVTDNGFATTTVCITTKLPCTSGPLLSVTHDRANLSLAAVSTGPSGGATPGSAGGSRPGSQTPRVIGGHFGAGPWLSRDGEERAVQLYSLSGQHEGLREGDSWPNSFALAEGVSGRRDILRDGRTLTVFESRKKVSPLATTLGVTTSPLNDAGVYRVSYALDPDLGVRPDDDQLSWIDSAGVVVVSDPDSGAVAYGWSAVPEGARATFREYANAAELLQPETPEQAYREQRADSRAIGRTGDVRFVLTIGPISTLASRSLAASLIVSSGRNTAEAVNNLLNERQRSAQMAPVADSGGQVEAPESFALRQTLGRSGAAFSSAGTGAGASLSARAQLRQEGLTALTYAVPGGQAAEVRIRVYSNAGQLVRNLVREQKGAGEYYVEWDGLNERGERVAPGVYVALMEAGTFKATRKLVITH